MRISDWSSDVCSSDLGACSSVGADQERGYPPENRGPYGPGASGFFRSSGISGTDKACAWWALDNDAPSVRAVWSTTQRSEERRVGKEWVSTCRFRGAPYH